MGGPFSLVNGRGAKQLSLGVAGIEPARPYGQGILNPQRLPFRHTPVRVAGIAGIGADVIVLGKIVDVQGVGGNTGTSIIPSTAILAGADRWSTSTAVSGRFSFWAKTRIPSWHAATMAGMVPTRSGKNVNTSTSRRTVECLAPAKVNLTLAVLGRRPDGYHELESWIVMLRWYDRLVLTEQAGLSLAIEGECAGVVADESNLVWRAAVALAGATGRRADAAVTLRKQIPIGGGLGGGSSDAAAALVGLNRLWEADWPVARLAPIAAELGSDVPLFLEHGSAIIRGRGEQVERLADGWKGWLTLIVPDYAVSTPEVYRRWTGGGPRPAAKREPWRDRALGSGELGRRLFNELEAAAFAAEPRLKALHGRLDGLDGRSVRMTGSGSCLFAVFDAEAEAQAWGRLASELLEDGEKVRVVETV